MIELEEIEVLVRDSLGENFSFLRQVNETTIRINLHKESFLDIFQSVRDQNKFAFHLKIADGRVFRLDSRPEKKYQKLKSFPWHLHEGSENRVVSSPFSTIKRVALKQFFAYAKKKYYG